MSILICYLITVELFCFTKYFHFVNIKSTTYGTFKISPILA